MSPHRHLQAAALVLLAATPAFAADAVLGVRTELMYDDNVLGSESNTINDGELMIAPRLEMSERWGSVEGKLDLKPNYELFFTEADLRGFNVALDGSLDWVPTQRTSVRLDNSYWHYRSLRLFTQGTDPGGTPIESGARDPFDRDIVQLAATHRLTPVDVLQFSGSYAFWQFSDDFRFDQQTYGVSANYQHNVTRTVSLGSGASYSRVSFEQLGAIPSRDTDYVNLSLIANYVPTDTFFVKLSVGPTYIRQGRVELPSLVRGQLYRFSGNDILVGDLPSTCPTLPTGEFFFDSNVCNLIPIDPVAQSFLYSLLIARSLDPVPIVGAAPDNDDLTYFADVSLERKWTDATLSIAYRRDEGSNSSAGVATIADTFELRGMLRPLRPLTLNAAVVWEDRQETQTSTQFVTILDTLPGSGGPAINNLVPVAQFALNDLSTTRHVESLTLYANARYLIGASMRLDATLSWRNQDASARTTFNDYERFTFTLGMTFELEPFRW